MFTLHHGEEIATSIEYDIRSYDCVIVTDFGHGTMTKELIERVSKESRFLAVNAQTNTTNYGFNLITKYRRADLVVVDELEARLAAHDRDSDIEDVILALGYKNIIVTMGYNGAVGFDGAFHRVKGTTKDALDTMGAGDAFLAVAAPFAAVRCSMREVLQIGNAAGVAKIGIVGHRQSVTKEMVQVHL
jgi:sugar/nucleoside kinase (ribokinase family)